MAVRTTTGAVKKILDRHYDADRSPDLQPFIETATAIVARVEACAIAKETPLTSAELELIERYLSAHFYEHSDPMFTSKSTAGASGSHQGQFMMGFDSTKYGQTALRIDPSGCLASLDKRQRAGGFWLGKRTQDQIPYNQRNT